jgi:hypothetical protein
VLLTSETVWGGVALFVIVAPVMLNWKNRTTTPAGGESVSERPTGAWERFELGGGVVATCVWPPHPEINSRNNTVERSSAALRILASLGLTFIN